ncbi:HicB family (HicB) [Fructobacillus fructosus]|uniref:hypothetical protein n=1 Tax=Fructobacillus fructosus TaxID=1631 RepID=UPI000219437E|nr:hypothetical protein [Fructobacillus fructosus]KRN53137.1 hypothetical protein IV71_GL000696 [Fructobacillus fructosus KCTC 3544]MCK8638316.1 hypothetical protein [Fructobacillus fructosus]CAK1226583.1 HicB family (HicB) [Fructobacillus fructosus]CAK1226690.1 HicB family (HicB) [Fructobacillus fructosus]CAK1226914.1 HicB family (HicB) [Fructobacillus fructosus]
MLANFEKQNIVGQVLPASSFDSREGLVEVIGNFYHYRLVAGQNWQPNADYRIKAADGNQLVVEKVEAKG